ncbi:MAG: HEAT repeat domain-containing protein [Stigonema ocellatum SAG 48.90 = DSM 106950]|nr:HEAT repeat domain-containing protein [Stigonema ocellatum SAG 48.90 = DSM 106950]
MVNNINKLLVQAQAAHDAANWSSLIQCLQQLILEADSEHPEIVKNREYLLELALSILTMGDFQQRWEIAKVFSNLGTIAISPLIEILEDDDADEELRWYVTRILGDIKNPEAIPPLLELLKTNDHEEFRAMAAAALGQIGTVAISALSSLLKDEETRLLAVRSLSYIRHTQTIIPLLSVVQDPQIAVRVAAIEALGSFHDGRVPPVLLNALGDVTAVVRREAVIGLGYRPDLCSELDLVTKLQQRLYDVNQDVCCAAAIALSRMGCDTAAYHLFQVLVSQNTPLKLQLETIRALISVGKLSGLEFLQQALNQVQSLTLWQEIVRVLGRVNSPTLTDKAAEILLEMLQSKHPAVEIASIRSAIALSLGQLATIQAWEPLMTMLADQDPQVRLHAIAALKNLAPHLAQ